MADLEKLNGQEPQPEPADDKPAVRKPAAKPAAKSKKPGFFRRVAKWFRDLRAEARKVIWPGRRQVVNNTIVVIVMVIVVAAFVAALDFSFGFVRDFLARLLA